MKQTLGDFVLSWNMSHKRFTFSIQEAMANGPPIRVSIRYSAAKYQRYLSIEQWDRLVDIVPAKSHSTMYIVSSEELFRGGIVEILVASSNHNYQERFVVGVLKWIGEEFFPKEDENA